MSATNDEIQPPGSRLRPNKQKLRSERSSTALLDAACDIVLADGIIGLTFAAIGERSGYSRGMVTARFGNKDGLIEALIARSVDAWSHERLVPVEQGRSGLASVLALIDAIRTQASSDARGLHVFYSLMFSSVGTDESMRIKFAAFHETMRSDLTAWITQGQNDGTVRPDLAPEREAELLVAALRGIGFQWLLDRDAFDPLGAVDYLRLTCADRLVRS